MIDYNDLKPGLYLQQGTAVKRIAEGDDFLSIFGSRTNEIEKLAESVAWVFIALNKRRTQMGELFRYGSWQTGEDNPIDAPPFAFNVKREMVRIDEALQLTAQAYLLKQRKGRRLVGLRWLDPTTVEPDEQAAIVIPGGVQFTRYWRTDPTTGRREPIDGGDIIHFMIPGQRELDPGTSAGVATKLAAQVMYGMGEMFSTFYANNALPVYMVIVPAATSDKDREEIRSGFWRIFNPRRGTRENRTIGVREGVTVQKLSIDPESLDAMALEDSKIKAIVTAHDVPYEVVATSANYAVSQDRRREFVGAIGQRMEDISEIIANDPDIKAMGIEYRVDVEQHWSMKRDEADAAIAFQRYLLGLTPQAAGWLMGITEDSFPEHVRAAGIWATQQPQSLGGASLPDAGSVPDPSTAVDNAAKAAEQSELAQFRRWYKKRLGADVDDFTGHYVTKADKLLIADELLRSAWEVYP